MDVDADDMRGPAFKEEPILAQLSPRTQGLLRGRLMGAPEAPSSREHNQVRVPNALGCDASTIWSVPT